MRMGEPAAMRHPMVYDRQTRGQSFMLGVALSYHDTVGGGTFSGGGGAKPSGLDI
jgi:hypothetical protein